MQISTRGRPLNSRDFGKTESDKVYRIIKFRQGNMYYYRDVYRARASFIYIFIYIHILHASHAFNMRNTYNVEVKVRPSSSIQNADSCITLVLVWIYKKKKKKKRKVIFLLFLLLERKFVKIFISIIDSCRIQSETRDNYKKQSSINADFFC